MKKYYLALAATMLAASVSAQSPIFKLHAGKQNANHMLQSAKQLPNSQKTSFKLSGIGLPSNALTAKYRKAAGSDEMITKQPEGQLYHNWYQYTEGYYVFWGYVLSAYNDGNAEDFVIADDNKTVYLKNPISNLLTNTWIKGYKAEGDTIAFDLPQKVYQEEDEDGVYNYSAYRMNLTVVDDPDQGSYKTYIPDANSQTIKFVLRNDSLFKTDPDVIIGLGADDSDGAWTGYGDWVNQNHKVKEIPDAPSNPSAADKYLISYQTADSTADFQPAKVAFEGNDVYLGGINPNMPDAWVKGKLNDNKVTFDKVAYLGVDTVTQAHTYFIPAGRKRVVEIYDDEEYPYDSVYAEKNIVFDYDAKAKTLKSEGGFIVNKGILDINQQKEYFNPSVAPWAETAGTPAAPTIYDYMAYDDDYGYGGIQFSLDKTTADGNFLDPAKLYYNVYLDDEKYTFYTDEYPEFKEDMTDIPYSYNGQDVTSSDDMHIFYFYTTGFEKMGIQEVYIDEDGKRYPSEIAWISADGTTTAIKNATSAKDTFVKNVTYTDLSGRKVNRPAQGIYIKSTTLSDGTVKTTKVLVK